MVMRAFDYGELDGMRATQDSAMMDTCILGERVELSRDVYGMPVVGWSWGDPVICGLNPVKHVEIMDGTEVVLTDAVLRLPIDTVITHVDRVQITHRYGETLITPWVFACIGMPRRGPSGLLLNLRLVTFGAGIAVGSGSGSGAPLPIGSGSGSGTPLPGSGSGSGAPLPGSGSGSGWPMGSGSGSGSGSGEPVDPYAGYLLYDSFPDIDGVHVHDHVPEKAPMGAAWADADGVAGWTIASNKAVVSTAPGEQSVKIDCGAADVSVKVAKFTVGTYTSILARGTAGALNGILFYIESAEDRIEIGKYDGSFSQLGTVPLVCAPGDVFDNVELRCSGTTITALIDGVQQLQITSTFNQTETHVGLLSYTDTGPNGAASDFAVAAI